MIALASIAGINMNNKIGFFLSKLNLVAALAVLMLVLPLTAGAQEITGSVRGTVLTPSGNPAAGATVTVTDTRTATVRTVTTNENGGFNVRGLAIGGPFTISVSSTQYKGALITDVFTNLSSASTFNIPLEEGAIEEIITTASVIRAPVCRITGPWSWASN